MIDLKVFITPLSSICPVIGFEEACYLGPIIIGIC